MSALHAHLKALEAESIHILREVAAQATRPVLLYSIGKDSSVLLHLARKAFYPARPPFPLLHIDTTWKFRAMIRHRDATVRKYGLELIVHTNPDGVRQNINPFDHGSSYTQIMKTDALKQALTEGRYDFAIGGARRDEERSRAKERVFSVRGPGHTWEPKRQRPELWHLYNGNLAPGETLRVFPLSNWTELDVWTYILAEQIDVVPLYFAAPAPNRAPRRRADRGGRRAHALQPGRATRRPPGPLPLARLLPAVGRGRLPRRHVGRDRRGDAHHARVRTRRAADRPGPGRLDGSEEARGILLMPDSLLRVLACGSVDDGKSTLIGRLLFECGTIPDDVMAVLERDSRRFGTTGGDIDYALLVDGLAAERDQGITIDVAYRYFETPRRRFILADAPGHQQYTRNMVTGASQLRPGDRADRRTQGRAGPDPPARRHRVLAGHPRRGAGGQQDGPGGLRPDGVRAHRRRFPRRARASARAGGDRDPGLRARRRQRHHAPAPACPGTRAPPCSPRWKAPSPAMTAARGRSACRCSLSTARTRHFRGYAGTVAAGTLRPGDTVVNAASRVEARVARIVTMDGDLRRRARRRAGDAGAGPRDRRLARRRAGRRAAAGSWPNGSRRAWCGWTTPRCSAAAPTR